MKATQLGVDVTLESIPVQLLPPNCELLARTLVGDLEYALVRAPRNRELYLLAAGVAWRLDVPRLLATFADQVRAWDRQRELLLGIRDGRAPRRPRLVKQRKAS